MLKIGDMLKVYFYEFYKDSNIPEKTWYGIIVDDIADDRGYIKGRYLHDGFIFSITNDGNTKDHLGRIVLEKIS